MALCCYLTHREGIGSIPDIRCTRHKGIKEADMCSSSQLTHRAQLQLWRDRRPLHPQTLFIFSSSGGGAQVSWNGASWWIFIDSKCHADRHVDRQTKISVIEASLFCSMVLTGWHFPAWVLTSPAVLKDVNVSGSLQTSFHILSWSCCIAALQMVVSRFTHWVLCSQPVLSSGSLPSAFSSPPGFYHQGYRWPS
jgi:hypothetical protein